ncbi:hypothetical protein [Mucilaginibacter rigui]|uniref:hypothetical protein n=1 Tax=Mucilaginibacter rigui TaxID=534635 RepID=UPI001CD136FE|nr:hypothetical protein [Mucilaginibacter rigui]
MMGEKYVSQTLTRLIYIVFDILANNKNNMKQVIRDLGFVVEESVEYVPFGELL